MKALVSKAILIMFILTVMACATAPPRYMPPTPSNPQNTFEIEAPFDVVWPTVVRVYADRNIGIKTIEKDSGLIASDSMLLNTNEFLNYMDPGRYVDQSGRYRMEMVNPKLYTNIFVEELSGNNTSVRINLRGTVQWMLYLRVSTGQMLFLPPDQIREMSRPIKGEVGECQSKGILERDFFKEIVDMCNKKMKK